MLMPLNVIEKDNYIVVSKHDKRYVLDIHHEQYATDSLTCHFLEKEEDLFAVVLAPSPDPTLLVHRIVSFLGAYIKIHDKRDLESAILRRVTHHNLSPRNIASTMA